MVDVMSDHDPFTELAADVLCVLVHQQATCSRKGEADQISAKAESHGTIAMKEITYSGNLLSTQQMLEQVSIKCCIVLRDKGVGRSMQHTKLERE